MKNERYLYIFIGVVGFLAFIAVVIFFCRMTGKTLTNIESGLFAIALAVFTTSVSMIFSISVANRNLNEQLKMYGKLAMRRISQSIKSCKALILTLNNKYTLTRDKGFSNKEVSNEFLENILGQIARITSGLFDSKQDWSDILADERKEADEIDKEYAELILKYQETSENLIKTRKLLKDAKDNKPDIEKRLTELENENKKIKEELLEKQKKVDYLSSVWPTQASTSPTVTSSSLATGGTWSDIGMAYPYSLYNITCVDCGKEKPPFTTCSKCGGSLCVDCSGKGSSLGFGYSMLSPTTCKRCSKME